MATSPFSKAGVSRVEEQGVYQTDGGGFTYDPGRDVTLPKGGVEDLMKELRDLDSTITQAANELIQKGRGDQAQNLRILGDRLKRTANTRGVSREQIARQMTDVTNELNAKQGVWESQVLASKIDQINRNIQQKTGVQAQGFNQDLQRANFRENVLKAMEDQGVTQSPLRTAPSSSSRSTRASSSSPLAAAAQQRMAAMDQQMAQRAQDWDNKQAITGFLQGRQTQTGPSGLYRTNNMGGATPAQAAAYAVAQRNMGVMPGLFQSGPNQMKPASFFNPGGDSGGVAAPSSPASGTVGSSTGYIAGMNPVYGNFKAGGYAGRVSSPFSSKNIAGRL